jgi:hypothetical protein
MGDVHGMEQTIQHVVPMSPVLDTDDWFSDSDIIHLNVAGTSVIVLSSLEAAVNLLEKRSAIYSDRQAAVVVSSPLS